GAVWVDVEWGASLGRVVPPELLLAGLASSLARQLPPGLYTPNFGGAGLPAMAAQQPGLIAQPGNLDIDQFLPPALPVAFTAYCVSKLINIYM
ncbi:hypothetical protein ABE525_26650, partial [Pseudomonas wadenswilerensis]|uniref:hypothetical protein n=1 Tax=Pseudomonas wadenswilerensis TaxID=1785161 RepID=UPI0032099907